MGNTFKYFQCDSCGSVMDIEEEQICWDCGKGYMIYKHDEALTVPCRHMLVSLIRLRSHRSAAATQDYRPSADVAEKKAV